MKRSRRTISANNSSATSLAGSVAATVSFALSRGFTMSELEAEIGFSGSELMNPDDRVGDEIAPKIWRLIVSRKSSKAVLSLQMAKATPLSFMGGLAHGAQFASDLRSAVKLFVDNANIVADRAEIEMIERDGETSIISSHPMDELDWGHTAETSIALIYRVITNEWRIPDPFSRVEFRHGPNGHVEEYEKFFDAPVSFHQPRNAIVISKEKMGMTIAHANEELFGFVQTHYSTVRRRLESLKRPPMIARLEAAIMRAAEQSVFSSPAVAAEANMSLRSAQRAASEYGSSLNKMIEEIRTTIAKEHLSEPEMKVSDIAHLLGYSDDRAFRRAFKRRTGSSPSEFRRSL